MYEKNTDDLSTITTSVTGVALITAGATVLPNNSGNNLLMALSMAAIITGTIVLMSFAATRATRK